MSFVACSQDEGAAEQPPLIDGKLELLSDVEQIRSDGVDAVTFLVQVVDSEGQSHDVTNYAEIFVNDSDIALSTNVFTTDTEGKYVFYAIYGMNVSDEKTITAIDDIPELPSDPQADNLSFRHRIMLVQHTGATCSNCPRMMNSLKTLSEDDAYNGLYHHVASHSYNAGADDAAYSQAARNLSMAYNTSGNYPLLTFNLTTTNTGSDLQEIRAQIDKLKLEKASAGISASVKVSGDDILVNVEVKSAKDNNYRVAAWLLEDGIYSLQAGMSESWQNTHDNALRYTAGASSQFSFVGEKVGFLSAGQKAGKVFVIPMEDQWKIENCKVLIFVTEADENGNYDIANCVQCHIDESKVYEYK